MSAHIDLTVLKSPAFDISQGVIILLNPHNIPIMDI